MTPADDYFTFACTLARGLRGLDSTITRVPDPCADCPRCRECKRCLDHDDCECWQDARASDDAENEQ